MTVATDSSTNTQDITLDTLAEGGAYLRRTIDFLGDCLSSPILELGSGSGNVTLELLRMGHDVVATDIDAPRLKRIEQRYGAANSQGAAGKLRCELRDLESPISWTPLTPAPRTVLAINVIEHVYDDLACAKAVYDALAPSGAFAVLVPAHQELYSDFDRALGHHRRYTKESLHKLLADAGFDVERCRYFNLVGALGWFINCTLLGKTELPAGQFKFFERLTPLLALEDHVALPAGLSVVAVGRKRL